MSLLTIKKVGLAYNLETLDIAMPGSMIARPRLYLSPAEVGGVNSLYTTPRGSQGNCIRSHRVYRTIEFLKHHLADRFTEEGLAFRAGVTREHFARLFKSETGESPMSFLRRLRYEEARVILESEEQLGLSIKEVAAQVGIHDLSHFVRQFESRFGLSPERYRKEMLRRVSYLTFRQ